MSAGGLNLTPSYPVESGVFDEAFEADGSVRPLYEELLSDTDPNRLEDLERDVQSDLAGRKVQFGAPHSRAPFGVDAIPRLITDEVWRGLELGLIQRVKTLNAFLADAYGERKVVQDGVIRAELITEAMHFEPVLAEAGIPVEAEVAGPDLVRGADGEFSVIEDNLRTPSGLAYSTVGRPVLEAGLGSPTLSPRSPEPSFDLLAQALRSKDPTGTGEPSIALLSDGPISSAWYEHQELARRLGVPVVSPGDLHEVNGRLKANSDRGQVTIDVLYNRSSTERLTLSGERFTPLGEVLIEPMRRGTLACLNSFGTGVADDKALHCYVDELIRYYLDEEPILNNTKSYDLGNPEHRDEVIDRLGELVIKPRWTFGGQDIVIGPRTPVENLRRLATSIRRSPERYIAQEMIMLSTHPTTIGGSLSPRHVDLRPYVLTIGEEVKVAPVALSRFARKKGELIVSSTRGGGAKDTWILER
ncbi:MAG: circularly permuted type 2 ATP-grasp protein [Solirubrobacterales bacterium]